MSDRMFTDQLGITSSRNVSLLEMHQQREGKVCFCLRSQQTKQLWPMESLYFKAPAERSLPNLHFYSMNHAVNLARCGLPQVTSWWGSSQTVAALKKKKNKTILTLNEKELHSNGTDWYEYKKGVDSWVSNLFQHRNAAGSGYCSHSKLKWRKTMVCHQHMAVP